MHELVQKYLRLEEGKSDEELNLLEKIRLEHSTSIAKGFLEILVNTEELDLPWEVKKDASKLFVRAREKNLLIGYGRGSYPVANACIYLASKKRGYNVSMKSINSVARCKESRLERSLNNIEEEININPNN